MLDKIRTKKQYDQVMEMIETYLGKATKAGGFDKLSKKDTDTLQELSLLAANYEDNVLKIMPLPVTLPEMVERKSKELKINQAQLAVLLEIDTPKLSQILNGKRNPDITFIKAVYNKLKIDPKFILDHV